MFAEESVKDPGPVLMSAPALPPLTIGAEMLTAAVAALTISSLVVASTTTVPVPPVRWIVSVPAPAFIKLLSVSVLDPDAPRSIVLPAPE